MSESNEQDNDVEEGITRCICGFTHDDGYMIWCDGCSVWQHLACMELDQARLPDKYFCETCHPRPVNADKAKRLQKRFHTSDTDPSEEDSNISVRNLSEGGLASKVDSSIANRAHSFHAKHSKKHRRPNDKHPSICHMPRGPTTHPAFSSVKQVKHIKSSYLIRSSHTAVDSDAQESELSSLSEEVNAFFYSRAKHYGISDPRETQVLSESVRSLVGRAISLAERSSKTVYTSGEGRGNPVPLRPLGITPYLVEKKRKGIMCSVSPLANQLIAELRGDVLDADTLSRSEGAPAASLNRDTFTPFLFQYRGLAKHSVVYIDSRAHGNKARYVRRSCEANAAIRHYILDSQLKFGIFADRDIPKEQELTIPHDSLVQTCSFLVECGCGFRATDCPARIHNMKLKRKQSLPQSHSQPHNQSQFQPQSQPQSQTQSQPQSQTQSQTQPQSHNQSQPQPQLQSQPQSHNQSQSQPHAQPQTQSQPQTAAQTGGEEKTYPDTTIKLEAVCPPHSEEDLESPINFTVSKKRKRPRIESDPAPNLPHSTATTPVEGTGAGGLSAIKKSREDRKLEGVLKLFEKMERQPSNPHRKSSSQEDTLLLSPGIGPPVKHRRHSDKEKLTSNAGDPPLSEDCPSREKPPEEKSDPNRCLLSPPYSQLPASPSVFGTTPLKKLLIQQWGEEEREMEGQKKKEVLLADLPPECSYPLSFPPHPFSQAGEYSFSRWGYTLSPDASLYQFRGAPKRRALASESLRAGRGDSPQKEECLEPVSPEDSEWIKKLPIKKQLVYLFNKREREARLLSERAEPETQVDMTSDVSQDSDHKLDLSEGEQENSLNAESPPRVHSTTSDQMLPLTDPGYMSPLPVQYSPSPQSSPNPVSPLSIASSSPDSPASEPFPRKIPHTPSPEPPPPRPPTLLSRADSCISQVSSTLDSPQFLKPLVSDYASPSSSPAIPHSEEGPIPYPHPLVTQDISPAEETPRATLTGSDVPLPPLEARDTDAARFDYCPPSNPKIGLERAKASSLDSAISSEHKKFLLAPDPPSRRSLTSYFSPRFDPFFSCRPTLTDTPLDRRVYSPMLSSARDSQLDLSVQFGSPSMDTDTPITPVEAVTPLSDAGLRSDGSNLSASGRKVVTMKEYFKRKEESRASSISSQPHLHLSPGHTPPLPRGERSRSNSSVNNSEPSFWKESRRGKDKRPEWDRERDRYHHWDNKGHYRYPGKEGGYRAKDRSRDKHKSRHRDRYRDRYEDSGGSHAPRDYKRRATSGVFEDTRPRYSTYKNTDTPLQTATRPPCAPQVEIEPVSPDNSGGEGNILSPSSYPPDRRFSTPSSLPLGNETIPPNDSRLLTLKVLLRQKTEQANT